MSKTTKERDPGLITAAEVCREIVLRSMPEDSIATLLTDSVVQAGFPGKPCIIFRVALCPRWNIIHPRFLINEHNRMMSIKEVYDDIRNDVILYMVAKFLPTRNGAVRTFYFLDFRVRSYPLGSYAWENPGESRRIIVSIPNQAIRDALIPITGVKGARLLGTATGRGTESLPEVLKWYLDNAEER